MIKIGITGNIGSGKTVVANIFKSFGIPVFNFDKEAKNLYNLSIVGDQISQLFGKEIIKDGNVDKKLLASIVFNDSKKLIALNKIIHPIAIKKFSDWCNLYENSIYIIAESAIIFESGINTLFDFVINVSAPVEISIDRVIKRDNSKFEDVVSRLKNQMSNQEKTIRSHYNIINDEQHSLLSQALEIHHSIQLKYSN